jgi:hypothetical protein
MIDAKDLRIGNWLNVYEGGFMVPSQLKAICFYRDGFKGYSADFDRFSTTLEDEDYVFGIPLTEEILVKAGFDYLDLDGIIIFQKEEIRIFQWFALDFYYRLDGFKHAPIEYVHQLQNLYFFLTGTELNI